ncbi:MAG: hypothetical protein RMJ43_01135 [Chloroherpetonaceae bacterium]|nr:hypothetical protein [Chthonomonadaceae bacterium]MDW8206413.1 hypothetical protein [Chloroherpetonaceae bacterium]
MQFPSVDPIPVPAPVWLMKVLSLVTLALHFSAVMLLVGSLLLVLYHNTRGRSRRDADQVSASFVLARRLPVIMTYVINLGIPPLLFAQVLYGRALYTSSILIGVLWFAVIPLLMLAYWLLYRIAPRIEKGQSVLLITLVALGIVVGVGHIYAMNMTLMLRPEVWQEMYARSPYGLQGVSGDPTVTPRWLFVMSGGLVFGGLWAALLAGMPHLSAGTQAHLRRSGGGMTAIGAVIQVLCALMVVQTQPVAVRQALVSNALYPGAGLLFLGAIVIAAVLAVWQGMGTHSRVPIAVSGLAAGFLSTLGAVVYRDGIRDVTLLQRGFDVWQRTEVSNWSVIVLFLLLFVIMLGVLYWLLRVMQRATPPGEQVVVP